MIEFDRVSKKYGDITALNSFSLKVPTAKITVLMGLSGSGKTTAIRMVNKMVTPTSGSVSIDGVDVAARDAVSLRRTVGYVIQEVGLLPHKTVRENVSLIARIAGQPADVAEGNATEMLTMVGIDEQFFSRYPQQLSGGQQQRVGVARALAIKPNILLMDEPFGAVDPIVREELQDELCRIQRELGLTIIFVTHDRHEAVKIADQLVVLSNGGHIEQAGAPSELTATPANAFVRKILGV
ncbi:MAG: ATP-binding cassette domain-containing protein [Microbacteriaceae bacterium]|nr:ATP-binding cassette domain-containing protein [Microbacteriaceae bacterium]